MRGAPGLPRHHPRSLDRFLRRDVNAPPPLLLRPSSSPPPPGLQPLELSCEVENGELVSVKPERMD